MNNNPLPLITLFVFAYNQEAYVKEACKAALMQDYPHLEIIFSDDCSNDCTFDIMKMAARSYQGPHSIKLNRNSHNIGLINHVNLSFQISTGEIIVAAAGDDISVKHRVSRIVEAYLMSGKSALVIHSNVTKIDENGCDFGVYIPPVITQEMSLMDMASALKLYIGASGGWNKKIFEYFGPLYYKKAYEDLTLGFRAALFDSLIYIDESLVNYRFSVGISHKSTKSFDIFKELKHYQRVLSSNLDVYRQRMMDLRCAKHIVIDAKYIEKILKKKCSLYWIKNFPRFILAIIKSIFK